ncbi:uncharacterized protein HD556DRAFT_1312731 [Suillus plorans]|uniref:Uncharacterized protein n=1 Tax=Suillus plorans TaxID=116603 RepID=A0A9P7AFS4_9AGAM|nr:uncharacterized protein HD556DRAFT_1312731 [Suillus plorans]KAG1787404.1 hypothetical protein HD556DRAFT_1312731 [Suillus plorans]
MPGISDGWMSHGRISGTSCRLVSLQFTSSAISMKSTTTFSLHTTMALSSAFTARNLGCDSCVAEGTPCKQYSAGRAWHQEMHNTQLTAMVLQGPGCGHCMIMKQDCIGRLNEACVACKQQCSHDEHGASHNSSSDLVTLGKQLNNCDSGRRKKRKLHAEKRQWLEVEVRRVEKDLADMKEIRRSTLRRCEELEEWLCYIKKSLMKK